VVGCSDAFHHCSWICLALRKFGRSSTWSYRKRAVLALVRHSLLLNPDSACAYLYQPDLQTHRMVTLFGLSLRHRSKLAKTIRIPVEVIARSSVRDHFGGLICLSREIQVLGVRFLVFGPRSCVPDINGVSAAQPQAKNRRSVGAVTQSAASRRYQPSAGLCLTHRSHTQAELRHSGAHENALGLLRAHRLRSRRLRSPLMLTGGGSYKRSSDRPQGRRDGRLPNQ